MGVLEIIQTFEEQYQEVHNRQVIESCTIDQTLLEAYNITKEDLDGLIEFENMMNERRAATTLKRDLSTLSLNLQKINLNMNGNHI